MPVKLKKFGPTATESSTSTDFINPKGDLANPIDPRIKEIQRIGQSADPNIKPTLPDGTQTSYKSPLSATEQKIYNASVQANKFASKITSPLQKFYTNVNNINQSIDAVKGIIGERGSVQRALNQVGNIVGIDVFSLKKKNKERNDLIGPNGPVAPLDYPYPRIAWEITTQWRILKGEPPIKFYVNPNTITLTQNLIESTEQLQKGYLITNWKDINVPKGNRFPKLDVQFGFQSSNILPESYAQSKIDFTKSGTLTDTIRGFLGGKKDKVIDIDKPYTIPPGLLNFFDIISIFNEDRTISKLNLYNIKNSLNGNAEGNYSDLSQIKVKNPDIENFSGTPNYIYVSISTRIYPKMTLKGFFRGGYTITEDAMSPLSFKTPLNFVAFETDPAWWDTDKIKSAYKTFYQNQTTQIGQIPKPQLQPSVSQEFNKIPEFKKVAETRVPVKPLGDPNSLVALASNSDPNDPFNSKNSIKVDVTGKNTEPSYIEFSLKNLSDFKI